MHIGKLGSLNVDINVNKRVMNVSIGEKRLEIEAETETDAYDMLEEYSAFLKAFLQIMFEAVQELKGEKKDE